LDKAARVMGLEIIQVKTKYMVCGAGRKYGEHVFNTFSPAAFKTLKSTVPGYFTTLWKLRSTSTPSGQLARDAVVDEFAQTQKHEKKA
jgi:hypothetical protein